MRNKIALAVLLTGTGVMPASAGVSVQDAWIRALPASSPSGGYFTLHNDGKSVETLVSAASPACGMLMLHLSENKGGMSGMSMVEKVPLPAGGDAKFSPGGFHLMCEQPKMRVGGKAMVSLSLSDGSSINVNFDVKDAKGK